ncbi:hypothetical protein HYH03_000867 [Edaphochlamys debaryana]|uniref:Uncharacterized protein n=1 Tax=Edaphochlamys debaryana TaxID=47281 RepID=A0A835YE58_9CHLO|nr:hypothetical protein HYH03_000867 [Edaphochlamys debaryana]|eukprot:KAG2501048.1 hypothetical protein HYH03_000867 [Edaphochlamys debaryana]
MIDAEEEAAQHAIDTGIYGVFRCATKGNDYCTRVGPSARCFCGHSFGDHQFLNWPKTPYPSCKTCACRAFQYVPKRPEEVGEWWLPRRKGFNVHTWRAKCRCGHGHDEHDPNARRCRCGCPVFQSNFACLACDLKWEDHETVFETARERLVAGRPVGDDFRPLMDPSMRELVFPGSAQGEGNPFGHSAASAEAFKPCSLRRANVPVSRGEKGVRIMAASSGGAVADQELANRWGKVENPPQWPPPPALRGAGPPGSRPGNGFGSGPGSGRGGGGGLLTGRAGGGGGGEDDDEEDRRPFSSGGLGGSRNAGGPSSGWGSGPGRPASTGRARPGSGLGGGGAGRPASPGGFGFGGGGSPGAALRPSSAGRRPGSALGAGMGQGMGTGMGTGLGTGMGRGMAGAAGLTGTGVGAGAGRPRAMPPPPDGPRQLTSGFRPVYD